MTKRTTKAEAQHSFELLMRAIYGRSVRTIYEDGSIDVGGKVYRLDYYNGYRIETDGGAGVLGAERRPARAFVDACSMAMDCLHEREYYDWAHK